MTYRINILPSAVREVSALSGRDRKRIDDAIISLGKEPRPVGTNRLTGTDSLYRIRTGKYRIIYQIEDSDSLILVVKIGHRREVYKRLGRRRLPVMDP